MVFLPCFEPALLQLLQANIACFVVANASRNYGPSHLQKEITATTRAAEAFMGLLHFIFGVPTRNSIKCIQIRPRQGRQNEGP